MIIIMIVTHIPGTVLPSTRSLSLPDVFFFGFFFFFFLAGIIFVHCGEATALWAWCLVRCLAIRPLSL